jgi:hypothetical protein
MNVLNGGRIGIALQALGLTGAMKLLEIFERKSLERNFNHQAIVSN